MLLRNKVVIVTGAGRGLGRAYALACAAQGASIVVNDVDRAAAGSVAEELIGYGHRAALLPGPVEEWATAGRLVEVALNEFGRLDGLVTNAGVTHHGPPWTETEESLRRIVAVNVLGTQFCAAHTMRAMVEQGTGGSIVTVVSGARAGIPGMSAYGATKGAVAAMTAGWALDGAPHGIRVNAISPLAETDMAALDGRADRPRLGAPDDVAPAVVALLSDATSGVTGRIVRFDGTRLSVYTPELLTPVTLNDLRDPAHIAAELTEQLVRCKAWSPHG